MMSNNEKCQQLLKKNYSQLPRSDNYYSDIMRQYLAPEMTVLDAGCGRHLEYAKQVSRCVRRVIATDISVDLTRWSESQLDVVIRSDLKSIALLDESIDLIICRSVFEHLSRPLEVVEEFARVLKRNGYVIFLTPNLYDYVSILSRITPYALHKAILSHLLGWDADDLFPTFYRMNTINKIRRIMCKAGLRCVEIRLVSHYPAYLMFSTLLLRIGILYESIIRRYELLRGLRGSIVGVFQKQ